MLIVLNSSSRLLKSVLNWSSSRMERLFRMSLIALE